jgi:hypothetical protein
MIRVENCVEVSQWSAGHPSEDVLEEYVFGRASETSSARLEEHLLWCERCQGALQEIEAYVRSMKTVLAEPTPVRAHSSSAIDRVKSLLPRPQNLAWASALAAIVVVILVFRSSVFEQSQNRPVPMAPVALSSFRGGAVIAHAPARQPLQLYIDLAEASTSCECRVEVVNGKGAPEWSGAANIASGKLIAEVPRGLAAGQYWVRLYSSETVLVREFGLRLE